MAIIKRAKNIFISVKNTHTTICGRMEISAESINITSTKENLVLASNKKVIVRGENGGVKFGKYISSSPEITSITWMNEDMTKEISHYSQGEIISLLVCTKNYKKGEIISIAIKREDNSNEKEKGKDLILTGSVDDDGYARLKAEIDTNRI